MENAGPVGAVVLEADVVVGIHELQRALGKCAGVLDRDQDTVGSPAGRQRPARKIGGGATTCQRGCNRRAAAALIQRLLLFKIPYLDGKRGPCRA
jgi:hypothetical protein